MLNVTLRYVFGQGRELEELQWHLYALGFLLALSVGLTLMITYASTCCRLACPFASDAGSSFTAFSAYSYRSCCSCSFIPDPF